MAMSADATQKELKASKLISPEIPKPPRCNSERIESSYADKDRLVPNEYDDATQKELKASSMRHL